MGEGAGNLVEGAVAAGEHHEGVGKQLHGALALVEVGGGHDDVVVLGGPLAASRGHHTHHAATGFMGGTRHFRHKPGAHSAVHQRGLTAANPSPCHAGAFLPVLGQVVHGTAINCYGNTIFHNAAKLRISRE